MAKVVCGLYDDSALAGEAVAELKGKGLTESISVVSRDETGDVKTQNVDQNIADGTAVGAGTGAAVGALAGILVGAASFVIPGAGLVVLGPLATTISGAVAGALTGGIVGALVDLGIPEDQAKKYENAVKEGQVLVTVAVIEDNEADVTAILSAHGGDVVEVGDAM